MESSEIKAALAERKFDIRCMEKGYVSSEPTYPCRYDRIVDKGGSLYRVQVKFCNAKAGGCSGAFHVGLRTFRHKKTVKEGYTEQEIDALVIYLPSKDKFYWFPPSVFHSKTALQLRVEPPKKNFKFLDIIDYEF